VGYWIDIGPNDADADASTTERLFRDGPWDKETEERKRNETLESSWQLNGCMGWLIWEGMFYHVYRILLSIYDCGEFSFLGSYPSHPLPHLFVSSIELMDRE
jgi:hypothetical protein